jgi:membrane-associated PAP2 superfamily phosphatase
MNHRPTLYARADDTFWTIHAGWPLLFFGAAFVLIGCLGLDRRLADTWFFDVATGQWWGGGAGDWWARGLLHTGGRWLVRALAALSLGIWMLSFWWARCRPWRWMAGFTVLAMVSSIALVGLLKAITNVDCPWDLAGYGGTHAFVPLFADRPDYLPRARCFPGAHASSGFALVCFYFAWRSGPPARARFALIAGILTGAVFALGQEARGAHFLSHDLAGAAIVWFTQLGLYRWMRRGLEREARGRAGQHAREAAARRREASRDTAAPACTRACR